MIILDTNVISELMLRSPEPAVLAWMDMQAARSTFTTAVSLAEIFYGIRIMPAGQRRRDLDDLATGIFYTDFNDRVLPFDGVAGDVCASIAAHRRALGRPIGEFDAQIAAIALSQGASVATRNVRDFEHLDLDIINPWDFRA
jgi:predicted nucleic acid-binding protein